MNKLFTPVIVTMILCLTACGAIDNNASLQEDSSSNQESALSTEQSTQESASSAESSTQEIIAATEASIESSIESSIEEPTVAATESIPESKEGTLSSFYTYDLDGNLVDETIFANDKLTMINIWATFCGPCLREMPELGELAAEYASKDVQIVGIVVDVPMNTDGSYQQSMLAQAKELVDATQANYLHLLPSDDLISAKLNSVSSVPETIFVDASGNLVGQSFIGSRNKESWAQIIEQMLSEVDG